MTKASQGRLKKVVIIAAVLVAGAGAGLLGLLKALNPNDFEAVAAVSAQATSELPDAPAGNTIDIGQATWWSEAAPGDGKDQSVTVTLEKPFNIEKVGIFNGQEGETFLLNPRPRNVRVDLLDPSGAVVGSKDVALADQKTKIQIFGVGGKGVNSVKVTIVDVYPGQAGGSDAASISDLQFFIKK